MTVPPTWQDTHEVVKFPSQKNKGFERPRKVLHPEAAC